MTGDPTLDEIEAGAEATREEIQECIDAELQVGEISRHALADAVLAAVLPDHDARVRAETLRWAAERLEPLASAHAGDPTRSNVALLRRWADGVAPMPGDRPASAASVHGEPPAAPAAPSGRPEALSGSQAAPCPSRVRNDRTHDRTFACVLSAGHSGPHESGPHMWGDRAPGVRLQSEPSNASEPASAIDSQASDRPGWDRDDLHRLADWLETDRIVGGDGPALAAQLRAVLAEVERLRALETAAIDAIDKETPDAD